MEIPDIDFEPYCTTYGHTAVAGCMHVDSDDVHTVAKMRRDLGEFPVECETCDATYSVVRGWQE